MSSGATTWSSPVRVALPGLRVEFVDLASEPTSNLVAGAFIGLQKGRRDSLGLSMWDSQRWQDTGVFDNSLVDVNDVAMPGAVGWSGTSRDAICVYADRNEGTLDWARWTADTGWSIQADVEVPSKGFTAAARLTASSDGGLFCLLSDSEAQLYALRYDSTRTWGLVGDVPLGQELASPNTLPFGLTLSRRHTLFVGDASAGGRQSGDLGGGGTVELLSFALVPGSRLSRVDSLVFDVAGVSREDWSNVELVVDENANGTVDVAGTTDLTGLIDVAPNGTVTVAETTTVAGSGLADTLGRLVFLTSFDVSAPTHYVLRATLPALGPNARVTVSLSATGVVTPSAAVRGHAVRQLDVGGSGPVMATPFSLKLEAADLILELLGQDPEDEDLMEAVRAVYLSLGLSEPAAAFNDEDADDDDDDDTVVWGDDFHIDPGNGGVNGEDVFEFGQQACEALHDYLERQDNEPSEFADEIDRIVVKLLTADRLLAETAIADAEQAGGEPHDLSKASKHLTRANALAAGNDDDDACDAIEEYGEAWEHAVESRQVDDD